MDATVVDPLVGVLVDDRYEIVDRIARGGMATVYEAIDTRLERTVALKVMHRSLAEDPSFVARFVREARSAARLTHPNVVSVYDQGTDTTNDLVFLVMEHVPSQTLRDLLREHGRLELREAFDVIEPVLAALAAAHAAGIVHRDVKPENVLLASDGRVLVADFGLARATTTSTSATTQGVLIGTVAYLAPEQVERGIADPRSDVYAAGILLYEMLTGQPPFAGETPLSVAYQHVNEVVPAPSELVADLPGEVDELLAGATARDPDERYAHAGDSLDAVRATRAELGLTPFAGSQVTQPRRTMNDTLVVQRSDLGAGADGRSRPGRAADEPDDDGPEDPAAAALRTRRRRRRRGLLLVLFLLALTVGIGVTAFQIGAATYVAVPAVLEQERDDAVGSLVAAGLTPLAGEEVFSETVEAGKVVSLDPAPNTEVRTDSLVTFVLSKGPERFAVPKLVGLPVADAKATLESSELAVGEITRKWSETAPKDSVLSTKPEADKPRKRGSNVNLVISRGPQPIDVPKVAGKSKDEASKLIDDAGLKFAIEEKRSESVASGTVISQSPAAGKTLNRGQTVTIVVSTGPPPVEVPNLVDRTRKEAIELLESLGLVGKGSYMLSFGDPLGIVRSQGTSAGEAVPKGSTVSFSYV